MPHTGMLINTLNFAVSFHNVPQVLLEFVIRSAVSQYPTTLQGTKESLAMDQMNAIWETCKENGVLLGKGGLYGSVQFYIRALKKLPFPFIPHKMAL